MDLPNFSKNLIRLRHEKGVTQEELADFIGITKSSVSKWETRQTFPDIMLLPLLASFFDVTVDELLGYEPQLNKEQIQKNYQLLAADFATLPFEDVIRKCQLSVKKYYSCYPYLLQVSILLINHFMLAESPKRQMEVLMSAADLCSHILKNCKKASLCSDAVFVKAMVDLQCGRIPEVIDALEDTLKPYHFVFGGDPILVRAYRKAGESKKADSFAQISMYRHLLSFMESILEHLENHAGDMEICMETLKRADQVLSIFHIEKLNPNIYARLQYQAAVLFCGYGNKAEALGRLECFCRAIQSMLSQEKLSLHGDSFFFSIDQWFEESDLGKAAPRDKKVIVQSIPPIFENPVFAILEEEEKFKKMKELFR